MWVSEYSYICICICMCMGSRKTRINCIGSNLYMGPIYEPTSLTLPSFYAYYFCYLLSWGLFLCFMAKVT